MIIEIIQTDLAPCDHFGMPRQTLHVLVGGFIRQPGFVRMNAERRVNEIVFLRQSNSAIHLRGTIAVADGDYGLNPGLPRPIDHLLAIGVELLAIEMRVRINEHGFKLMWGQPHSVHAERKLGLF